MQNQLPLGFTFAKEVSFESFQPGENAGPLASLQSILAGDEQHFMYLWGLPATGKSHLLQAAVTFVAGQQKPVAYLPLKHWAELHFGILQGLERMSLVCVDDVNAIAGNNAWEEALFHLFNRCQEYRTPLVVTSCAIPQKSGFLLKDLESRLSWGVTYQLKELDDTDKMLALQFRANARGMKMHDEVCRYMFSRYSRNLQDLFVLLDKLDKASLTAQRKLTIPFVRQYL